VSRFRTEAAIALSCHHEISALELGLFAVFGKTKRAKGNCPPVDLFLSGRRVAPSAISLLACFVESAAPISGCHPGDRPISRIHSNSRRKSEKVSCEACREDPFLL
jgi:hypothetical protein